MPAASLTSVAGKALYEREPGRFRKDRLEAYRSGVARALASLDRPAAGRKASDARAGKSDAMARSMAAAEVIKANVADMLQSLAGKDGADVAHGLMPGKADFAAAFAKGARDEAEKGFEAEWAVGGRRSTRLDNWRDLEIDVAAAGLLQTRNALSDRFPGAYLEIADKLAPHNVWICWRYVTEPDGSGECYDGLVWLNGPVGVVSKTVGATSTGQRGTRVC